MKPTKIIDMFKNQTEQEIKEQNIKEARRDLIMADTVIELAKDNVLACEIHINSIKFGLCRNDKIIPAIKYHKKQIELFLNGEKNEWE